MPMYNRTWSRLWCDPSRELQARVRTPAQRARSRRRGEQQTGHRMFMAGLQFTTHAAAEFDPPRLVGSLEVVEVDLSSMLENIFEAGDAQMSPWWRGAAARMKVRSPSSTPSFPSFFYGEQEVPVSKFRRRLDNPNVRRSGILDDDDTGSPTPRRRGRRIN